MRKRTKLGALLLAASLCLGVLAGCGENTAPDALALRVGVTALPASGDPAMETDIDGQSILLHLYEGLMRKSADATGAVSTQNGIARSYTEEENFDGTVTYTFKLRDSAKWSDGRTVTAEDFVYAWQRLADPVTHSPNHELLRMVAGYNSVRSGEGAEKLQVTAKNENTLIVKLAYRCPYFISDVCTALAAAPLRKDIATGEAWAVNWTKLVTNGAYTVLQAAAGQMETARRENYYDTRTPGPAALDFLALDTETAWQQYKAGELDAVSSLPEEQLAEREKTAGNSVESPGAAKTYSIVFNNEAPPLNDPLVRQALSLTLDRAALAALAGTGTKPAEGLVPAGIAGKAIEEDFRTEGGPLLETDPEHYADRCVQAQTLLGQSSYSGGDTFPALEYLYEDTAANTAVAKAAQAMWRETLQVNVTLRAVTAEELEQAVETGNYTLAAVELGSQVNDAMGYLERWGSGCEDNIASYSNSAFNTLLTVIRSATDEVGRLGLLHDAELLLMEDMGVAPLLVRGGNWELRAGLSGAFRDTLGRLYFSAVAPDING